MHRLSRAGVAVLIVLALLLMLTLVGFRTGSSEAAALSHRPTPTPTRSPTPPPASGTWTMTGSMNHERYNFTATLLSNGQVLVAGGILCSYGGNIGCNLAEVYTP